MLKKYANKFLAEVPASASVYLTLGNSFPTSFQYYKDFVYKLNLLFSFWSKGINIKLKYQEPVDGYSDPLQMLSKLAVTWANGATRDTQTLHDRITIRPIKKTIDEIKSEANLLLKF